MNNVFLQKLKIEKVRNIENVEIDLTDKKKHLILTGKNGSGKTSVLDSISEFIKNSRKYDEKILDCYKVDPEERLVFKVEEDRVEISTRNEEATEIDKMTAQLITEVFNLKNTGIRTVMCEKRVEELNKEMNILYTHLQQYKSTQSKKSLRIIKSILRRNSPFSAFKREYIRMNRENYFELEAIFSEVEIFC